MWHGFYGGGWPMLAGGALFWGIIVFLIAWGIHRTTRHHGSDSHYYGKSPHAKGEITKEQYEETKRDLMQ